MTEIEKLKKEIEDLKQIIESKNNQVESKNKHIKRLERIISNIKKRIIPVVTVVTEGRSCPRLDTIKIQKLLSLITKLHLFFLEVAEPSRMGGEIIIRVVTKCHYFGSDALYNDDHKRATEKNST